MADRDKILKYFRASGDEDLAAQLLDLAERANKTNKFKVSAFLDPHGLNVAEIVAANLGNMRLEISGGFVNSERAKAAFVADGYGGTVDYGMDAYQVTWDKRYYTLAHRDILGAFMGLGCERDILGDIIFVPAGAQFVADKTFNSYILDNLTQIGAAPVQLTNIDFSELEAKEEKIKLISATVAALRLDAVAAAGYGVSRSRMADEIKGQNVKVNWKDAKNASQTVAEGDVISFRSRGRVEVAEIRSKTKKGRISITLKRFV